MSTPTNPPPLRLVPDLPGRGRALVTTRRILPGEILLSDQPILLYPSSLPSRHCLHCFRPLPPSPYKCPSCSSAFCSPSCLSHPQFLCLSLPLLPHLSNDLLFLLSAYSLHPSAFSSLLSLHPPAAPTSPRSLHLHSLLSSLPSPPPVPAFSPDLTAALLAKDHLNAFGIMDGKDVRAYGIYPNAAFFNHDCLPNACRFDYIDAGRGAEITVRAIHEIPEGREVCLSYFPVNWGFAERQRRLREDYGFTCACDRCEVEKNWKDDDGNDDGDGMEEEEDDVDFPHAYFFVKFQCRREGCGGTLAPLPPSSEGVVSDLMECNACGCIAKEDEDEDEDAEEEGEGSDLMDD